MHIAKLLVVGLLLCLFGQPIAAKAPASRILIMGPGIVGELVITEPELLVPLSFHVLERTEVGKNLAFNNEMPVDAIPEGYEIVRQMEPEPGNYETFDRVRYYPNAKGGRAFVYYVGMENGRSEFDGKWFYASSEGQAALERILATVQVAQANCESTQSETGISAIDLQFAPYRSTIGDGYVITGKVLNAETCQPVARARVVLWHTNPEGEYDDAHRATLLTDHDGEYRLETNRPVSYGPDAHIHFQVRARGYETLETTYVLSSDDESTGSFDIVLSPVSEKSK